MSDDVQHVKDLRQHITVLESILSNDERNDDVYAVECALRDLNDKVTRIAEGQAKLIDAYNRMADWATQHTEQICDRFGSLGGALWALAALTPALTGTMPPALAATMPPALAAVFSAAREPLATEPKQAAKPARAQKQRKRGRPTRTDNCT